MWTMSGGDYTPRQERQQELALALVACLTLLLVQVSRFVHRGDEETDPCFVERSI